MVEQVGAGFHGEPVQFNNTFPPRAKVCSGNVNTHVMQLFKFLLSKNQPMETLFEIHENKQLYVV